jgi:hypothetical protein
MTVQKVKDKLTFQDFYRNDPNHSIYLSVLAPIFFEQDGRRPLGVLVLRTDPQSYLYPFIQGWPIPVRRPRPRLSAVMGMMLILQMPK